MRELIGSNTGSVSKVHYSTCIQESNNYLLENARLPTQLGWVKPATTIYQEQIVSIMDAVQSATTIPLNTATATSDSSGFTLPPLLPLGGGFNPYLDVQSPDDWNELLSDVGEVPEDIVDVVLDILDFSS